MDQLIAAAKAASEAAYAPYSGYRVGAAVLVAGGAVVTGCNVENASYGLTICAERAAIFAARCAGHAVWEAVAIYAPQPPAPLPCGACRQVMAEGGNEPEVIVAASDGSVRIFHFDDLLPNRFMLT
ncbi:cytidine deaminase [bacterium]|nr:cytidine deaminase [candidate division CSSED10-310 bacterium]